MLDSICGDVLEATAVGLQKRPGTTRKYERARNRGSVLSLLLLSNRRAIESAREPARTKSDCQSLLRWPLNSYESPGWGPYRNTAYRSSPGLQDCSSQHNQCLRLEG